MDQVALMHRIMALMMGRHPSDHIHAVFVFGRAQGDYEATDGDSGILEAAAPYAADYAAFVVIPNQDPGMAFGGKQIATTFPGTAVFRQRLEKLGVHSNCIVTPEKYELHTRGEGDAYVKHAKERKWTRAVAVMHPHQALRTMLGLLKSFALHQYEMSIFPITPTTVNWQKKVYGSQGELLLPRHEHIHQEWDRIMRYQAQGDLASFEELQAYLQSF